MLEICVIGDLHGRAKTLGRILRESELKNKNYHYVFIGDIIHHKSYFKRTKKTSTIKMIKDVKELVDTGRATLLRGNNEQYVVDNINVPLKLIKSSQVRSTIEQLRRLSMKECDDILTWLDSLPLSMEAGKFRISHAYYPGEGVLKNTILSGPGYPWFKRDNLSDHLSPDFTYIMGHYGYPFIRENLKIIDATLFEGVGVYYTDRDEFMVYY